MNDKPTGEWTADDDGVLLPLHRFIGQYAKEIAEAHNAALAAQAYQHGLLHAETLQQLAAERALIEAERKHNESTIVELEQQIAAERSLAKVKK